MSVLQQIASALGERGEQANTALAIKIASTNDENAVKELVENLKNKDRKIQNNCIKALYEIGERKPELIAEYYKEFLDLLDSKNPRMVWGATCAVSAITLEKQAEIYNALPKILAIVDKTQSVIARDHLVYTLTKLASLEKYYEDTFALLLELILQAPVNQIAMYAEYAAKVVTGKNRSIFRETLICRLEDVEEFPAKRKRIEKVLKSLEK